MKPTKKRRIECDEPRAGLRHLLTALTLSAITLLAFSNSFHAGFAWDNQYLILKDPRIRAATSENIGLIFQHSYWWPTGEAGIYRPLTTLSYLLNYALLGQQDRPAGYHAINFVLHCLNVLLVYALSLRLVRRYWPSVFIAAIWGVHPALTESVTNIVGRPDLLAALAILSGFLMYLKSTDAVGSQKILWLLGLALVTAVGVYSKENAVVIVGVIALYEFAWWNERRQWRSLLLGFLAVLPPIGLMLIQRWSVLAATAPAEFPFTDNPIIGANFWVGRLTAIKVIARYLWLTIWPARLSVDYSYSQIPLASGSAQDWFAWMTVVAAVIVVVLLYRRNRTAFFFACFSMITFLPTANLLFPIGTIMADRFLYMPSIGLLACLTLFIYAVGERLHSPALAPVAMCLITARFAMRTWVRNLDWKDELTLVSSDARVSQDSYKLHKALASALYTSDPSHSNLDQVTVEAERTLSILDPLSDLLNEPDAYRWSGGFYLSKGDFLRRRGQSGMPEYERALKILLRCIAIDKALEEGRNNSAPAVVSSEAEAYRLLSAVYLRRKDNRKATEAVARARSLNPFVPEVYRQRAEIYLATGNGDDAAVALIEGILLTSDTGVREDLISLYQSGLDTKRCAVVSGPNGPAMNPACEIVHRHICAASTDVLQARLQSGRRDLALLQKQAFVRDFGCPADPLNQVAPDGR